MELSQWHCRNKMEKKNFAIGLWQCHCRNRGVKFFFWQLWQSHCRKWEGKKKWFPKSWEEFKKKSATSTIFLQHFHNKLQVIRYY